MNAQRVRVRVLQQHVNGFFERTLSPNIHIALFSGVGAGRVQKKMETTTARGSRNKLKRLF